MRMRTSHKRRMQRPGDRNIGAKLGPTFEKPIILQPWKSGADSQLAHSKLLAIEALYIPLTPPRCKVSPNGNLDFVSNLS